MGKAGIVLFAPTLMNLAVNTIRGWGRYCGPPIVSRLAPLQSDSLAPVGHGVARHALMQYSRHLARTYSQEREQYDENRHEVLDALTKTGIKDEDVLDFGCGNGTYSEAIKSAGAHRVVGIDLSEPLIRIARERAIKHRM